MPPTPETKPSANRVLERMLDRLLAALVSGPGLNCRPHRSRQRVDLSAFSRLADTTPAQLLRAILGDDCKARCTAKVREPGEGDDEKPWREQEALIAKLRGIAEDARTYEQDTGARSLFIGFPLLSVPETSESRRVLAPVAFIPISLVITRGVKRSVDLRCSGDGTDRVIPNAALLAWIERQTGQKPGELFNDREGEDAWREIHELADFIASATGAATIAISAETELTPAPRGEEGDAHATILPAAVLGLFPQANESLLRDMQAMLAGEPLTGPIEPFVKLAERPTEAPPAPPSDPTADRLIADADPFQANAVRLARQMPALVIHGPPGTGKSQTITNVIGDHLARGQRVLVVSDKRTALDVVAARLRHLGIGHLFGVVHDPQRDRRTLYQTLRQQLEALPAAKSEARAEREIERVDEELKSLRETIGGYFAVLARPDDRGRTLQDFVADWFELEAEPSLAPALGEGGRGEGGAAGGADISVCPTPGQQAGLNLTTFEAHQQAFESLLRRAETIDYAHNPWRQAAGIELPAFMDRPMADLRAALAHCLTDAQASDATIDAAIPPFAPGLPLDAQAAARAHWSTRLADLLLATDPAILATWASRQPADALRVQQKLHEATAQLTLLAAGPLDAGLLDQCRRRAATSEHSTQAHLPDAAEASTQWRILRDYAQAYRDASGRLATVRAAAPGTSSETVSRWLLQGPQACERGRKRLIALGTLIKSIGAGELDRQLALQFERQPVSIEQVIAWLPILHDYLHAASKWYAFLNPGHKVAAKPIATAFGLPLNVASAERIRDFLTALRHRLDLKTDLENGLIAAPLPLLPNDDELLDIYREQLTVVKAACDDTLPPQPGQDQPTAIVHRLIQTQADAATLVLKAWDLDLLPASADRLATFLSRLNARLRLAELYFADLERVPPSTDLPDDARLAHAMTHHGDAVRFIADSTREPAIDLLRERLTAGLANPVAGLSLVDGLRKSPARAGAILTLLARARAASLFAMDWLDKLDASQRAGNQSAPAIQALADRLGDLDAILRVRDGLRSLPDALRDPTQRLLAQSASAEKSSAALRKMVYAGEIARRLEADPALRHVDGHVLGEALARFRAATRRRAELAREVIRHHWLLAQRQKLLAGEGARLGHAGAELRRRLTLRGEKATRLRQVIQMGRAIPGGDPLFDLCPVWMASPETVAQIFPREPIFDVVIFDEASQCRLEEALPVLTRARRVVVAGDPQQLPPTRFFESGVEESEEEPSETEQAMFESQQGQTEDLLAAALGLAIHECSLDVHYRSRDAGLIAFSNEHFYASRLQAVPGKPSEAPPPAPVKLVRIDGVYEKRRNAREADEVCQLVRELLEREQPPSIGIACFNVPQRDLIVEKLDALAEEDSAFAAKLEAARKREGAGSFEGLFVKNLENVQGDERDHLIISTTYGPDAAGKFRRQFGPVGQAGGGRRLNVLVTRAREAVHVITSIPREAYASLPTTPAGMMPGGAYLLLAYLKFAERGSAAAAPALGAGAVWSTQHPSRLVEALGRRMSAEGIACDVYWGNEGFCVDIVRRGSNAAGLLVDGPRFPAADAVEWDAFRSAMLEAQGWELSRLWSPHFFRDPTA